MHIDSLSGRNLVFAMARPVLQNHADVNYASNFRSSQQAKTDACLVPLYPLSRGCCEMVLSASRRDTPILAWHAVPGKASPGKEPSRRGEIAQHKSEAFYHGAITSERIGAHTDTYSTESGAWPSLEFCTFTAEPIIS
jgi:hypothetical protein